MTFSLNLPNFTKGFEGLKLSAYQDSGGVWTIGWGHTLGVTKDTLPITEAQAEIFLQEDLARSAEFVSKIVTVPLTQNQFDALVDFDFNLGDGRLGTSTLLHYLNQGNYPAAAAQFCLWIYGRNAEGKLVIFQGLADRRLAEHQLFLEVDNG